MGQEVSTGLHEYFYPETSPNVHKPPIYPPLAGFPKGRKKREMIATWEEMDEFKLSIDQRDYCAHTLIEWQRCRLRSYPLPINCHPYKHAYEVCQWEDYVMRMKEYEREKRLMKREKKLRDEVKAQAKAQMDEAAALEKTK